MRRHVGACWFDYIPVRIVFASLPAYGHLYPLLPLAVACAEVGHEVTVAVGGPFHGRLPVPTAYGFPPEVTLQELEREVFGNHPELADAPPELLGFPRALFGESAPRRVVPMLGALFESSTPDLVIHEVTNTGAAIAADLVGVRSIAFGLGLWSPMLADWYQVAVADHAGRWRDLGRDAAALDTLSGGYFDPVPPSLQDPGTLPDRRLPIRPVPWSPEAEPVGWLTAEPRRPRVYLTLGTVAFGAVDVLRRAVLETAAHDVDVLVAVGPQGDPAVLGDLPANVHVERFVAQADVLAHVDLAVHHGGAGTTLGALANGLPQLILPQGADQPFNAAAIEGAGAGRALPNDAQVPGAIGAAVEALLRDGPERLAAKRIAAEMAAMPAPADVAAGL